MAHIQPFKAFIYNTEKIKSLSKVIAPPYDVISSEEQDRLYNLHPYNIIRILLGKDCHGDNKNENKYVRAARFLKDWQKEGILKKNKEDALYIYLQEFIVQNQLKQRLGFIALLKLEDFDTDRGTIYPHEETLSAPKEDRAMLISSIEANLGPIFALFADEDKSITSILNDQINSHSAIIDIVDYQGIRNKVWRIVDREVITAIAGLMANKKLFIADGHHRYEVALAFSKIQKEPKYGYILSYFTDLYSDGIVILPVHRMIGGVKEPILSNMEKDLPKHFTVTKLISKEDAKIFLSSAASSEKRFVMYNGRKFIGLVFNDSTSLDVTVLHDFLINPLEEKLKEENKRISIDFTKDLDYAISEVDNGKNSFSVILNQTRITEIRDRAFSGKRMPQKSTYFYPKLLTGLVMNVF